MANQGNKYKTWIHLQQMTSSEADFKTVNWVTKHTPPASVSPRRGNERLVGEQILEHVTHLVKLRWLPDVTAEWRVLISGTSRVLNIAECINWKDENKYLILQCVEVS